MPSESCTVFKKWFIVMKSINKSASRVVNAFRANINSSKLLLCTKESNMLNTHLHTYTNALYTRTVALLFHRKQTQFELFTEQRNSVCLVTKVVFFFSKVV